MKLIEQINNANFDKCMIKLLDLEKKLEEKEEEHNELEVACKETALFYQEGNESLKKAICRNKELLKGMKVKKVHCSREG